MAKRWGFGITFFLAALALVLGISFMAAGIKRSDRPLATGDNNLTYADNSSSSRYPLIQQQALGAAPLPSVYGRGYNVRKSETDLKGSPGRDVVGRGIDKDNYKQIEFKTFRRHKLEASNLETRVDKRNQPGGYESYKGDRSESLYQPRMQIVHSSVQDTVYGPDRGKGDARREGLRGGPETGSQKKTKEKWHEAGTQDGKYDAGREEAVVTSKTHDSAGADIMAVRANSGKTVCNTADCEYMRWIVNASVDTRKNPCSNFYEYACGMANKALENDDSMVKGGMLHIITERLLDAVAETLYHAYLGRTSNQTGFEKVAALYVACQNNTETFDDADRNSVVNFLTDHHMLPTENLTFDPLDKQIELMFEGFALTFKLAAVPAVLTRDVKFFLRLPSDLDFLRWGPMESFDKRRNTYEEVFKDIFPAAAFNETTLNEFLIGEHELIEILRMKYRKNLRLIPMTQVGLVLQDKGLTDRWITALEMHTNWRLPARHTLHASEQDIHFLHNLFGSEAKISTGSLRKFLAWRVIFLIYGTSNHVLHRTRKQCLYETVIAFPFVALSEAIFQTEGITKEKMFAAQQMTQNILDEIGRTLKGSPWLERKTRVDAHQKLTSVSRVVGFPLGLWSSEAIDHYMMDVPDVGKSFLASTIEVVKAVTKRDWDLFLDAKSFDAVLDLFISKIAKMYLANATYLWDYNALVLSPAAIAKPVFIYGGPPEVNYGALGRLVSSEIMRAFDEIGQKYDAAGQPDDWFTNGSKMAFAEKLRCHRERLEASPLARRYGDHPQYLTDIMSADTLLRAYRKASDESSVTLGYVKGLTSEQLFYVSWCLLWCGKDMPGEPPLEGKCNLPLMNTEDFSEAFKCPIGAPMNAVKKCQFW
ncbi:membrane metallo-endopeptidase-like 1 [Ornithodoros turicata]|uniref:membrane metallo-endopeptidase-like 1 n=1 Tax=Ornithodoros turicata TaxID=34597 RepID=UPI003138A4D1